MINVDDIKEDILLRAKEELADRLENSQILKEIYVPNKIVNIVIKG
jgi:leucyl-tRNA synthetase